MLDLAAPIDASNPALLPTLEKVQGKILKGHGRDHAAHLFIVFAPDADAGPARRWLARIARDQLTSALGQLAQVAQFRLTRGVGEPFACVALSAHGYAALGSAAALHPDDPFFLKEMKKHNEVGRDPINDPPPMSWEDGYPRCW